MDTTRFKNEVVKNEGSRLQVYDDANGQPVVAGYTLMGNPTIGIGRNLADPGINEDEQDYLLSVDITRVVRQLDARLVWWRGMSDARQNTLVDMCFNLGIDRLLTFDTFLGLLKSGDFEAASNDGLKTAWDAQVGARATRDMERIRTGTWVT